MAELAKSIGSKGALVKKAERAAERWLEPRWAKLLPMVSDSILDARRDDARSFGHCALGLKMWFRGWFGDWVSEKEEKAAVLGAVAELEKAHGGQGAKKMVGEFLEQAGKEFEKGDPMPSKPSKLLGEIEDFSAVRKWLGGARAKDIEAKSLKDLNLLRSNLCDECFGRSSPLVKRMIMEEAQALLERIDKARIENASR